MLINNTTPGPFKKQTFFSLQKEKFLYFSTQIRHSLNVESNNF